MPKRTVNDPRGVRFNRQVSKSVRNASGKMLPRGWDFVDRDGELYIRSLKTGEETRFQ